MNGWNYAEWAERNGREHLRGRLATGDYLTVQANTLLSIVLAGIGAMLVYGTRIFDSASRVGPLEWGSAVCAAWLCAVAVVLSFRCIVTRETQVLFNEPVNIYKPELKHSRDEILSFEIENLQIQIDKTKLRNANVARWLDICRYAAIGTPAVFAVAAFVAGR